MRAIALARQHRDEDGTWRAEGEVVLPARSVFVAAGTQPNTVLAREHPAHFAVDGKYFRAVDEAGRPVRPEHQRAKPNAAHVLMSGEPGERRISFFGDVHPSWFGNVVKAMGSAKQGWPVVSRALAPVRRRPTCRRPRSPRGSARSCARGWSASSASRRTSSRSWCTRRSRPSTSSRVSSTGCRTSRPAPRRSRCPAPVPTRLAMEGLALTGAWVDKAKGLVSTIVLEMGGSSDLCRLLQPGEPVVLMGPTGTPTTIAAGETVVLAGGGLGNAVLFSIGAAFRAAGSKVLYFAGYKKRVDRYKVAEIEAAADVVVWCCDEAPASSRRGRRTARSSATSCRRCSRGRPVHRSARATTASARSGWPTPTASSRSARTG